MTCARCGSALEDGVRFCGVCGALVQASLGGQAGETAAPPVAGLCTVCGADVRGRQFCSRCGTAVSQAAPEPEPLAATTPVPFPHWSNTARSGPDRDPTAPPPPSQFDRVFTPEDLAARAPEPPLAPSLPPWNGAATQIFEPGSLAPLSPTNSLARTAIFPPPPEQVHADPPKPAWPDQSDTSAASADEGEKRRSRLPPPPVQYIPLPPNPSQSTIKLPENVPYQATQYQEPLPPAMFPGSGQQPAATMPSARRGIHPGVLIGGALAFVLAIALAAYFVLSNYLLGSHGHGRAYSVSRTDDPDQAAKELRQMIAADPQLANDSLAIHGSGRTLVVDGTVHSQADGQTVLDYAAQVTGPSLVIIDNLYVR